MRCGALYVAGLILGSTVWPRAASAAPAGSDEQPLRIQYTAHAGCPDALGFFWHVRARTHRVRLAGEGELATLVSVRIEHQDAQSVGILEMPGPESQSFERQVRASSCEEVVLALSLVLALAYDPDAMQTFPVASPAQPGVSSPSEVATPVEKPCPVPPPQNAPSRAAFGVDGLLMTGVVATNVHFALSGFLELGRTGRPFSPALTAAFVWVPPSDTQVPGSSAQATFGYAGGRLALCPLTWTAAERIELAPCVGADFGRLTARTTLPASLGDKAQFWGKGFLGARLRWNFSDRFFGETFGEGGVTFYSDSFEVEGSGNVRSSVFDVPRVVADFGVGVGAYFP
jgi:hypothetical protein